MNVALVHESLATRGGAERVFTELIKTFPDASVYALEGPTNGDWGKVTTSFLRYIPASLRRRRLSLPMHPIAPETFDLSAADVVISSSSAFAKGIVTRPTTLHLCYCHAPTRFLWDWHGETVRDAAFGSGRTWALRVILHGFRLWDHAAARRVDQFIANSETTRARIRKYYGRDSDVIYPPVELPPSATPLSTTHPRTYFLFLGRLSPYKRADLVIEAFNKLELPLVVAGEGSELPRLRKLARAGITFLGFVPDEDLAELYARARAVIFPCDDDFGIVPVEAMAAGTPVLALRRGGAMETVIEGVTGEFFDEAEEELLADCVRRFLEQEGSYTVSVLQEHARQFSTDRFRTQIETFVRDTWHRWRAQRTLGKRHRGATSVEEP